MNKITIDLLTKYHYLSSLNNTSGKLLFVDTLADMENNDYRQYLYCYDPLTGKNKKIYEDRRVSYSVLNDGRVVVKETAKKDFIESEYSYLSLDGNKTKAFTAPLAVGTLKDLNDEYYLAEANVDLKCPDYHKAADEVKKAYHDAIKADEDYIVLDEYPFFYNGAGFINGTRNGLFLISKKDGSCEEIVPATMDVEGVEVKDNKIYILGNDYTSLKDLFSSIYVYDLETKTLSTVLENKTVYIRRITIVNDQLYAIASEKTCISGLSFYTVENGRLNMAVKTEWMLNNSVCTDCHYGPLKSSLVFNNEMYLVNTVEECSYVYKFDGKSLVKLTEGLGSVDALTMIDGKLYALAMQDMKLQELYAVEGEKLVQLTAMNEELVADKYVAVPEKCNAFNLDEIHGLVLKPMDYDPNKKYPMILDIHGGPKASYGPVFYHEMQVWASMGYFVVYCNPHCSDGRGDDFSDYIKHYGSTDYFDIMAFVDKVIETYPIDTERLAVTGGSYGGYMTNWIIGHTDRFKVAASQRSISNRVSDFFYSDYSYDVTHENGVPRDKAFIDLSWERSPLKYADNIVTPTLFIQSTHDFRCPFPEALQLYSAMKFNGVEARVCGFKGENHELSRSGKPLHRLRRLEEITNWIDSHINAK